MKYNSDITAKDSINQDTIVAVATGVGGAIALIRLSGEKAIEICDRIFRPVSKQPLAKADGYTLHYGEIVDSEGRVLDNVIVSLFRAPRSYTGEDMIEVSCHASSYIQNEIIKLFIHRGARMAEPGEFTIRAFLAGKLDLSQAEAVADIISSSDKASHALASNQMRGGYSAEFSLLRKQLINLVSLLELELDFGEEDVEFADRAQISQLIGEIEARVSTLLHSFSLSNVIKEGVAVSIIGSPNVGKSTLLNAILKDDRAMVSDIAGTTRDVIEESINIDGIKFRFIDTAGIRTTDDQLEKMGIERTYGSIEKANIIVYIVEARANAQETIRDAVHSLSDLAVKEEQRLILVINKIDTLQSDGSWDYSDDDLHTLFNKLKTQSGPQVNGVVSISAKEHRNIDLLTSRLLNFVDREAIFSGSTIISNNRHYEALLHSKEALSRASSSLSTGLSADLLSQDIRESLHYLGTITGEITTDEILSQIFSNFCIGK